MTRVVHDLLGWRHVDDLENVELARRVLFTFHDQHRLKALVVVGAIEGRTVAEAVELVAFERVDDAAWVESAGALRGVSVKDRLDVGGVRCLGSAGSRIPDQTI